ncbi:hypothetical protein IGS68_34315 (plasmid) [Skermanella sp. TT6]|uniref:Uncharacterized protein n=1 Tax=Skermanella cutis TaxID=2775420 RepID=A0ABX7BJ91_9PROT|nr:hypothetical protein [Skermanella sp. TT6]QQP93801.1 hypothetical protein IGS68_34315 [Skermanella sp. TT6]
MLHLMIIGIAVLGMIWNVDLGARPYVDVAMWLLFAGLMFHLGDRFNTWLDHWAVRPRWRRNRRRAAGRPDHSGASIPLLDK